jgi:hypothetical protein
VFILYTSWHHREILIAREKGNISFILQICPDKLLCLNTATKLIPYNHKQPLDISAFGENYEGLLTYWLNLARTSKYPFQEKDKRVILKTSKRGKSMRFYKDNLLNCVILVSIATPSRLVLLLFFLKINFMPSSFNVLSTMENLLLFNSGTLAKLWNFLLDTDHRHHY